MRSARSGSELSGATRLVVRLIALGTALAVVVALALDQAPASERHVARGVLPRTAAARAEASARPVRPDRSPATATTPPSSAPAPAPVAETLLQPADVPAPDIILPVQVMGRIRIPKIGLDTDLRDQITQESIDLGPSHWPGTAAPGGFGNAVIAGHRNSHSAPFHDVGNLRPGDFVDLVDGGGQVFHYVVTEMFVVTPDAVWITEQTPGRTLTLFTCHPLGSAAERLVIRATLT